MDWLDWSAMGHDPGGPLRCLKKPVKTAEVVFLTVYVVICNLIFNSVCCNL